jgi:hypothetical protein
VTAGQPIVGKACGQLNNQQNLLNSFVLKRHKSDLWVRWTRKLTVAAWYLMMGRWTPLEEIDARLEIKISKVISQVGAKRLEQSAKPRKTWREEAFAKLKTGKVYQLDPDKKFTPKLLAATAPFA